jgi:hypothetical protein
MEWCLPADVKFERPVDAAEFLNPWRVSTGILGREFDGQIDERDIQRTTKAEIRAALRNEKTVRNVPAEPS